MQDVVLSVKNLTKKFGDFTAVDDISFDIKEGSIVGLLGPNGAGKTTTIQLLLGVLNITSGSVHYFGKDLIRHRETVLEQINFSSTYTNLPWRLTVKECLTFVAYLYDIPDRKKRIEKIAETFRIQELLSKKISELSAGQRTIVNLAKAFLNFPKILLLDEPTASLDPEVAQHVRKILLEQRKNFQMTIIITSHNMAEVEEMCDRVIFVNKGKIIADDTPTKLAQTNSIAHIEFLIAGGLEKIIMYCESEQLTYKTKNNRILIDIEEKEIASFLRQLAEKKIHYDEVSIEKPTLEDYFLQHSIRGGNNETA